MKKLRKNIIILLGAMISALGIFYIVKNPNFFTASILSLQEITTIKKQGWDIAYKTESGTIDIFIAEKITNINNIEITIQYNPETVQLDINNMTGQGPITILTQETGNMTIKFSIIDNIQTQESAIILPFTGEINDVLISESKGITPNGQEKNFSVGKLNQNTLHSQ